MVAIITKDLVIDSSLKRQIEKYPLHHCNTSRISCHNTTKEYPLHHCNTTQRRALHVVDSVECYKFFSEFSSRVLNLKLTGWQMTNTNNQFALTMADNIHIWLPNMKYMLMKIPRSRFVFCYGVCNLHISYTA